MNEFLTPDEVAQEMVAACARLHKNAEKDFLELSSKLHLADSCVTALTKALDLPFKPIALMPITEAKLAVGELLDENGRLRARIAELEHELSKRLPKENPDTKAGV